ncbi:choline/ethanolamine kinase-like [Brevipalpus obovatus]|uniref:choline/ethanolamine kinase-like n=1 Tax=Brevipalpus obovatus TaxID=246614 RepID=UPI003D9E5853
MKIPLILTDEDRQKILSECQDILTGVWTSATLEDIDITMCPGGIANRIYIVKIKSLELLKKIKNEPKTVIVRLFGSILFKVNIPKLLGSPGELLVFTLIGERGLGPKLLGNFEGGRIEEFIENIRYRPEELLGFEVDEMIAKKMARIHSLELPISKKLVFLDTCFDIWVKGRFLQEDVETDIVYTGEELKMADEIDEFDYLGTIDWLKSTAKKIKARKTFCHNDLHLQNVLFKANSNNTSNEDGTTLIDMELSTYNYRGYDFSYYFNFRFYHPAHGKKNWDQVKYPDEEHKRKFFQIYLNALEELDPNFDPSIDNVEQLLVEEKFMSMYTHLFIFSWRALERKRPSDVNWSSLPEGPPGGEHSEFYTGLDYSYSRYVRFQKDKKEFLEKYGHLLDA